VVGLAARYGQFEMREAQIDGDAAALLFFQAVGINAGQGFDQRGLAVIDVAGGADDDGFHGALKCNELPGVFARALFIIKVIYTCAQKQTSQVR
jgi:hypothetical protein